MAQSHPDNSPLHLSLPGECLVIARVTSRGMSPVHTDPVEEEIVRGQWRRPRAGDSVTLPDGSTAAWKSLAADKDGVFQSDDLRGGYAYVAVVSPNDQVAILTATGDTMAYVNGEPRVGDVYGYGYARLPVKLHRGVNDLLFAVARGELKISLSAAAEAFLNLDDPTLPDLMAGQAQTVCAAVIVGNPTGKTLLDLALAARSPDGSVVSTPLPPVPPLGIRKVGFEIRTGPLQQPGDIDVHLRLLEQEKTLDEDKITLRVREPGQTYKVTFVSEIDGSVQYYAVNPAHSLPDETGPPALFLTLHGASVEAIGQTDAYEPKSWGILVAPTNRRPYGYDWEDWGRLDALEVLSLAQQRFQPDPGKIYLTGHSMGGHGVWQLGALFPDRFAAIGPSAGWISFGSYVNREGWPSSDTPMSRMLVRANLPSDTLAMERNYAGEGVYILHGADDDNVPVTESRTMAAELAKFHKDFVYHEEPGQGHWWDISDEPGADCVDWAPMFDFFARHALPNKYSMRQVDFVTPDPGVSARCYWATIEEQTTRLEASSVSIRIDPSKRRFVGTTQNVARLALDVSPIAPGGPLEADLDGQQIAAIPYPEAAGPGFSPTMLLSRDPDGKWSLTGPPPASDQSPVRSGPFKRAFGSRMVFVYGTHGSKEENAWAYAKARYDAEQWWYRGNGSVDLVPDEEFDSSAGPDRSVIIYGNADTNSAWRALLSASPVQVRRGVVAVGDHMFHADDLACLFIRPRPGSATACVGVVAGSGIVGMRLADRQPYLAPGVGFPDCLVIGSDMLTLGMRGVRLAGYFGPDWGVATGDFVQQAGAGTKQ